MSEKVIKTILSPVIFAIIFIMAIFGVSAETNDEVLSTENTISAEARKFDDSTDDSADGSEKTVMPTMKPSYYTAKGSTDDTADSAEAGQDPTSATGVTSSVSTDDSSATPDIVTKAGAVSTSDTSENVFILMGLAAGTSLLIALHKRHMIQ